ncbi:hypothetical protein ACFWBB_23325 [Streptomyces sp. NPDC060000]|uniref:hypothetical protein n=1 Tax=Streptomyces sp. NPDC060000 TaxID=3347031 RepID=UPI0036969456
MLDDNRAPDGLAGSTTTPVLPARSLVRDSVGVTVDRAGRLGPAWLSGVPTC